MTDQDKIAIVDKLLKDISEGLADSNHIPVLVGYLKKQQGIKCFEIAEVGHPVFEYKDRYIIYLDSLNPYIEKADGKPTTIERYTVRVPYYKESLSRFIDFVKNE